MADTTTGTTDEPNDQDAKQDEHQDQGEPNRDGQHQDQGATTGDQADELTRERTAREAAEREVARLRRSNAAQKPDDLEALRAEIRDEFTAQLVRAELRAAAAGRLRDPADALALVDAAALAGKGGDIDTAAVVAAVDQLVKDKPYLAAETSAAPAWGDVGAGPREDAGEPEPATPLDRLRQAYGD
ncbi:hypothetical protein ACH4OW_23950 [Streptomyces sp. NPDC017056]|uniref:hypothetical protein n=1 Tax=Streptomyces sp. NPDC017056 TaxID=3364973 RepID=UPI00379BC489